MNYNQIQSLKELSYALDIPIKQLTGILYGKKIENCYTTFAIAKKSGGYRTINCPNKSLKYIQRKLARLLLKRQAEIQAENSISQKIAHAFIKGKGIKTNASQHRNKRYLLNIDLKDFFGTFHFGRVLGFFKKNKYFKLPDNIATIIAQLTCYEGKLPQGAPTSPIISNMIFQILDNKIIYLCKKYKLTYTRYADDMTFSTNNKFFLSTYPKFIVDLNDFITKYGFTINKKKIYFQESNHRQVVTGLSVNKKINVKREFYKNTRSMAYKLYTTGSFTINGIPGTMNMLEGRFSFINDLVKYNTLHNNIVVNTHNSFESQKNILSSNQKKFVFSENQSRKCIDWHEWLKDLTIREKDFQKFLFYKYFMANPKILIITEGKTDSRYIKAALKRYYLEYPTLIKKNGETFKYNISFFECSDRIQYFFQYENGGGSNSLNLFRFFTDDECNQKPNYLKYFKRILHSEPLKPVIFLFDNEDSNSKPLKQFLNYVKKKISNYEIEDRIRNQFYTQLDYNIFMATLPKDGSKQKDIEIEDLLNIDVINNELIAPKYHGKIFSSSKNHNDDRFIGKEIFSKEVLANYNSEIIDFSKFIPLLDLINKLESNYQMYK